VAKYGGGGGGLRELGRNSLLWRWKVAGVRGGVGVGVGRWFDDNIRRVMGNGSGTFF